MEEYQEAINQQRIDELENQLSGIMTEIDTKEGLIREPNWQGTRVRHKKFGMGEVKKVAGGKLEVDFESDGMKQFRYPDVFEKGFLQDEESVAAKQFQLNKKLTEEVRLLREKGETIRSELERYHEPAVGDQ